MSENLTALAAENLNPSLRSLLEDVQRGHIRVPRFQRPFVWTDDQRLELLESIRDNMPIGSLLIWRTTKFSLASFPNVGPHLIPAISEKAPTSGWQYLLDGHQRVSTLLGLLVQPSNILSMEAMDESIDWDIQYDLLDQRFVFGRQAARAPLPRPLLPLWTLFDGRLVNKHMRDLRKRGADQSWTDENLELWETRADQLSYRFQQCRIPVVVMVTDDLDLAARTFQRINSLGTPMSEAHLVAALTWRADFDLRDTLDDLRSRLPQGWRDVDDGLFLQVCKGLAQLDMTKTGQTELVKKMKADPALLFRAGSALSRAAEWLAEHAAVVRHDLLPYTFQAVLLALEFEEWKESPAPSPSLADWFWRTSWSETFASATARVVKDEQEILHETAHGVRSQQWFREPLPDRFDFRSARVRLVSLRLASREGLVDGHGQAANGRTLLQEFGKDSLVRLFSVPRGASAELKALLQGPGNRFLMSPATQGAMLERLRKGPDLAMSALEGHFIDRSGINALRAGDLASFLRRRGQAIEEWDRREWASASVMDLL